MALDNEDVTCEYSYTPWNSLIRPPTSVAQLVRAQALSNAVPWPSKAQGNAAFKNTKYLSFWIG